jgi:hypothetical protein
MAFFKYLIFTYCLALLITLPVHAQNLQLKPGLWEGIYKDHFDYNILEINENSEHRLIIAKIGSAFQSNEQISFTNDEIQCTNIHCTIKLVSPNKEHLKITLILSPYLEDSFEVLEIYSNTDSNLVISKTYRLEKQTGQSTVRTFMKKYSSKIKALSAIEKSGLYGFWVGLLNLDAKQELVSIEFYPDKKSHFARFINGDNGVISTSFMPNNITIKDNVLEITTNHPTFANKLLIHKNNRELKGYMYSTHKGTTLETGSFKLYRFEKKE